MACFGHNPYVNLNRIRWGRLAFCAAYLAAVVSFAACGGRAALAVARATMSPEPVAGPIEPAPKTVAESDNRIDDAQARADRAQHDLDVARADLKQLRAERDWLVDERARARLAWTAGLLQLVVIGFGALAFASPVGRTWLVYAAVGAEAAAVIALALRAVYAWLPLAGCIVGAAFVAIAVWKVLKLARAGRAAADHGDRLERAFLGVNDWIAGEQATAKDVIEAVKDDSAKRQDTAGVRGWVAALRGKPKPPAFTPSQPPAPPAPPAAGGAAA